MKGSVNDNVRIAHILDAMGEIEKYLDGTSYDDFASNSEKRYATLKQIEIIGEACNRLSDVFKISHPDIPWKPISGFRNISIHEYFGVNFKICGKLPRMTCLP